MLAIRTKTAVAAPTPQRAIKDVGRTHPVACGAACAARQEGMDWLAPIRLTVNAVLPPRCPGCGAVTGADHDLCAGCWSQLRFLAPPWCAACHTPFTVDRGASARCAACIAAPPVHRGVRAAVAYDDLSAAMILRLKYSGHYALATTLAQHMVRLLPGDAALLVPVPLHPRRLWGRGFNQAGEIARALGKTSGVPFDPHLLRRTRATPVLRGLGGAARLAAVDRAFAIAPGCAAGAVDKAVVLIDDVYTSGATTAACSRVLLKAGAASVTILCWARVIAQSAGD